jgi:hypothetical protein
MPPHVLSGGIHLAESVSKTMGPLSPARRHGPNWGAICGGQAEWLALAACAALAGEKMPTLR